MPRAATPCRSARPGRCCPIVSDPLPDSRPCRTAEMGRRRGHGEDAVTVVLGATGSTVWSGVGRRNRPTPAVARPAPPAPTRGQRRQRRRRHTRSAEPSEAPSAPARCASCGGPRAAADMACAGVQSAHRCAAAGAACTRGSSAMRVADGVPPAAAAQRGAALGAQVRAAPAPCPRPRGQRQQVQRRSVVGRAPGCEAPLGPGSSVAGPSAVPRSSCPLIGSLRLIRQSCGGGPESGPSPHARLGPDRETRARP